MKRLSIFLTVVIVIFFAAFAHAEKQRGNAVLRFALPADLRSYDVVDYYLPLKATKIGLIQSKKGTVVVLHKRNNRAYFAQRGDKVFKGDIVFTLGKSRCRLKFTTRDVVTLGDRSRISMDDYVDKIRQGKKRSIFSMARGKAMFYVVRMFRYKNSSTSVRTQTAAMGVRGTKFGVELVEPDGTTARIAKPYYLADTSDLLALKYLAATNLAAAGKQVTVAYSFDGQIDVSSPLDDAIHTVGAGQNLEVSAEGAGKVVDTPANVAAQFEQSTEAPPPPADDSSGDEEAAGGTGEGGEKKSEKKAEKKEGGKSNEGQSEDSGGEPKKEPEIIVEALPTPPEPPPDLPDTPPVEPPTETTTTEKYGYFSAMLSNQDSSPVLSYVFVSDDLADFSGEVIGNEVSASATSNVIKTQGLDKVKRTEITSTPSDVNSAITSSVLGETSYMEWGRWTAASNFTYGSAYQGNIENYGYYVIGTPTPSDYDFSSQTLSYSGSAQGTWWSGSGTGDAMSNGSFTCNVTGNSVYDFTMTVNNGLSSTGQREVTISGGSGTIVGSNFQFDNGTFTMNKDGSVLTTTPYKKVSGSFYGTNAENIGGVWGVKKDSANGANGFFAGDKQ